MAPLRVYQGLRAACPWGRRWATQAVFHPSLSALLQRERSSCDQSTRPAVRRCGLQQGLICQCQLTVLAPPKAGAVGEPQACLPPRMEQVWGFWCLLWDEELPGGPSKIMYQFLGRGTLGGLCLKLYKWPEGLMCAWQGVEEGEDGEGLTGWSPRAPRARGHLQSAGLWSHHKALCLRQ